MGFKQPGMLARARPLNKWAKLKPGPKRESAQFASPNILISFAKK